MKAPPTLPTTNTTEIPEQGPSCRPVADKVEDGSSELREVAAGNPLVTPTSSLSLAQQACTLLLQVLFAKAVTLTGAGKAEGAAGTGAAGASPPGSPEPPIPPGPGPDASDADKVIWAVRILVQLLLMFLGTPPTTPMLKHSTNSGMLLPAIDDILKYTGAIAETDNRIFNKVDPQAIGQQRDMLVLLREIWKMFIVAASCVEAGITHVEQFLDGSARFIYTKLNTELGDNLLLMQDLQNLVTLVGATIAAGQQTRKATSRSQAAAGAGEGDAQPGGATPSTPQGGVNLVVNPPAPTPTPTPAVPAVTTHKPKAHPAPARPARPAKTAVKLKTLPRSPKR